MALDWEGFKSGLENTLSGDFSNIGKNLSSFGEALVDPGKPGQPRPFNLANNPITDIFNVGSRAFEDVVGTGSKPFVDMGTSAYTGLTGQGQPLSDSDKAMMLSIIGPGKIKGLIKDAPKKLLDWYKKRSLIGKAAYPYMAYEGGSSLLESAMDEDYVPQPILENIFGYENEPSREAREGRELLNKEAIENQAVQEFLDRGGHTDDMLYDVVDYDPYSFDPEKREPEGMFDKYTANPFMDAVKDASWKFRMQGDDEYNKRVAYGNYLEESNPDLYNVWQEVGGWDPSNETAQNYYRSGAYKEDAFQDLEKNVKSFEDIGW